MTFGPSPVDVQFDMTHHTLMCPSINPKPRLTRVYTRQVLAIGQAVRLEEGPAKHLLKVLRHQAGDSVIVFNGDGAEYVGRIQHATGAKDCVVDLEQRSSPMVESSLEVHLIQAIGRGERMDWVIQKATELGVKRITPVFTERTGVKLDDKRRAQRQARWESIAIGACEQSGRVHIPSIDAPTELSHWSGSNETGSCSIETASFYLDPLAEATLKTAQPHSHVALIIGPEGGLSPSEIDALNHDGAQGLRLGPRVMRTETAGPAAIAALQALWGDFR